MWNGSPAKIGMFLLGALIGPIGGCDISAAPSQGQLYRASLGPRPLKSLTDEAHQRIYLLVRDGVDVLDLRGGRKLAHIDLPGWLWAGEKYSCPPDIAFTPERDILVTSNVVPTIWRIERQSLATTRHELALDQDTGRDIGFTRLRWAQNLGTFVATTDLGARWYVDPSLSEARKVLKSPTRRPLRPCR